MIPHSANKLSNEQNKCISDELKELVKELPRFVNYDVCLYLRTDLIIDGENVYSFSCHNLTTDEIRKQ
jgi:hypothetical protein